MNSSTTAPQTWPKKQKQELVNFYDLISNDEEKQKIAAAMRADTHLDAFLVAVERKKNSPPNVTSILYVTVRRFIRIQSIPCLIR